jgi:DNA-binding Lrp family transcriptional regulator
MWDVVKPAERSGALAELRVVEDIETLRVLTDPLRLAILRVIMKDAHVKPRLMTVKEIAEELGEPPTKLYRHVKQLESTGVIRDAETRLVSGIVEHRYSPGQAELRIDGRVLGRLGQDDAGTSIAAVFDSVRDHFVSLIRKGQVRLPPAVAEGDQGDDYGRAQVASMSSRLAPETAADFYARLSALIADFEAAQRDDDGVDVHLFGLWFAPTEPGRD